MRNQTSDSSERHEWQDDDAQPIGDILEELLAQYECRFPSVQIGVIEAAVTTT